jgi:hypothetical protein
MTSFYNNFKLNNNDDNNKDILDNKNINVLKKDYTLNYTDYEKLKIAEQYNRLYSNVYETNKTNVEINENKKIYNLSLNDLVNKSGGVYINLLNDLSIFFSKSNNDKSINKLGLIITKEDNLLYIGVLVLFLSFLLWLIDITR